MQVRVEELEDRRVLTPIMTYHGGPLLANVQVEAVFMGWNPVNGGNALQQNEYNDILAYGGNVPANVAGGAQNPAAIPANANGFFPTILASNYVTDLGEYSINGFNIGAGTYLGGVVTSTPSQNIQGLGATIKDSQIQLFLQNLIANGDIPAPNANTLDVVFTQPGMSVVFDTQAGNAFFNASAPNTSVFGAYHFDTTSNGLANGTLTSYSVEPSFLLNNDPVNSNQFLGYGDFATNTIVLGHEIGEAVTDPAAINLNANGVNILTGVVPPGGWFYQTAGGEVGDLAASFPPIDFIAGNGVDDYWVAQLWSNVVAQSNAPHVLVPAVGLPALPGQPAAGNGGAGGGRTRFLESSDGPGSVQEIHSHPGSDGAEAYARNACAHGDRGIARRQRQRWHW